MASHGAAQPSLVLSPYLDFDFLIPALLELDDPLVRRVVRHDREALSLNLNGSEVVVFCVSRRGTKSRDQEDAAT
eukprot:scaffold16220_cov51-Attheya_sp.AAC.3